jgi:hypothetical protein
MSKETKQKTTRDQLAAMSQSKELSFVQLANLALMFCECGEKDMDKLPCTLTGSSGGCIMTAFHCLSCGHKTITISYAPHSTVAPLCLI